MTRTLTVSLCLGLALAAAPAAATDRAKEPDPKTLPETPTDLKAKVKKSIDKGLHYIRGQQFDDDGSYGHYPALTAIAVLAFLESPRGYKEDDGPFISRAVEYLLKQQKPDGGIYLRDFPTYNTALSLMAISATKNPKHKDAIKKAQDFLAGKQATVAAGYKKSDKYFGGIGYGGDERPDLSNLQFALEALKKSGYPADSEVFKRAQTFLDRCQNNSETNEMAWAGDDGGFTYSPGKGDSPFGGTKSYGAMSFAGLKSLIFTQAKKDDPRVKAVMKWTAANYTLDEHPGAGQVALFYYLRTFASAMAAYGEQHVTDKRGVKHDWYAELAEKLMAMQKEDGSWQNPEPKYWEGNPLMATAWAVLSLEAGY